TRGVLTPWSYIALAAAGGNLAGTSVEKACQALFNELKNGATTSYATLILTILSAGGDPFNYQGQNLVQKLQEAQLPSGKFADNVINGGEELVNAHIWAMLALQAAGASIPDKEKALAWLAARQHADGGFHWYAGEKTTADVDSTGMALMALGALGEKEDSPSVSKALAYLQAVQNDNGGFSSWGVANP
ncbi:MAG: terpene cyclase/mutase family protein, partial [Moorella sp. (in: Bacteria)]|nr:terpene cyclase/mutase family protein [Moorella sp. (in: firmicutes)]